MYKTIYFYNHWYRIILLKSFLEITFCEKACLNKYYLLSSLSRNSTWDVFLKHILENPRWRIARVSTILDFQGYACYVYMIIVKDLAPSYLSDLLTLTLRQRSGLLLRSAYNFRLFQCHTERFKFCQWNSLDYEFWGTQSLRWFKRCLQDFFDISTYEKRYYYALDKYIV